MEPVQSLMSGAVARLVRPAPLSPEKVLFAWRAAVGPSVSRVTRVRLASHGVLDVIVDDDRFGDELARSAPMVLGRLQELLGADTVRRLDVKRPGKPVDRRRRSGVGRTTGKREGRETMIKPVGVIGAGTMGNGIAQVFAQAGFDVAGAGRGAARARSRPGHHREEPREVRREGQDRRGVEGRGPRAAAASRRASTRSPTRTMSSRRPSRIGEIKRTLFADARPAHAARRHPDVEHVVDLDHDAGGRHQAPGARAGDALHEPGAADDAGRADPRPGHVRRGDGHRHGALHAARQDGRRSRRLPGVHRQPHPDADDQRGRSTR